MLIFMMIYASIYALLFILDNENKFNFDQFTHVKNENKRIMVIEILARFSFAILIIVFYVYSKKTEVTVNYYSLIFMITSILIFFISKKTMRKNWSTNITNSQPTLTVEGIFKYSRNPVYLAYHLLFLSFLFINFKVFIWVYIIFVINFHYLVLEEEKSLKMKFGNEYADYCKNVRRYI